MERIRIASLFCGIGGTDLGFMGGFIFLGKKYQRLPTKLVYANDNYNEASDIFERNFDINCDRRDIRTVPSEEIPDHDILTAGFPCQSFSIVAQNPPRLGYHSENGKLFFEVVRILKDKQPKAFIAENVKGLLSSNNGTIFPLILKEFENAGYNVASTLLNASEWGIPQKRERVFIVGIRKDLKINPGFPEKAKMLNPVSLREVLFEHSKIDKKYFFSERAVQGLNRANPQMNKGRVQNVYEPGATVTSHLAKVSLNSTDPVLKVGNSYRRFTPREVARIQSFPDTFKLIGSDFHQYKGIGNAIPPVLMWHVGRRVIKLLSPGVYQHHVPIRVSLSNRHA